MANTGKNRAAPSLSRCDDDSEANIRVMDASLHIPQHVYTVHASRDAPLAFSVYDAYVRRPRCVRVWERMPLPVLGSDDICSVTTDAGISRMFFSLLVSELPSPKKGFTGMMQTAAVANKHETLLIQYPA